MHLRTGERRRAERLGAYGPAILRDSAMKFVARCRVTNLSADGAFLMVRDKPDLPREGEAFVELVLTIGTGREKTQQTSVYRCRVIRSKQMGELIGLGLEFLEKVG